MADHAQVNLKLLYVFQAVVTYGSFRKAADVLNKSESAVSMQIKQLEDQLGVPLFHRTTRSVKPTREAEQLLGSTERALHELDSGLRRIREAADIISGTLSLACVPTVASARLPLALAKFRSAYPGFTVRIRELATQELVNSVRSLEVDFAIGPFVDEFRDLDFQPICKDRVCAFGTTDMFPQGKRKAITLAELSRQKLLLNSDSAALRSMLTQEFRDADLSFDVAYEVLHTNTLIAFAEAGLGIAILPEIAIPGSLHPDMCYSNIGRPAMHRTLGIITMHGHSLSPGALKMVEATKSTLKMA